VKSTLSGKSWQLGLNFSVIALHTRTQLWQNLFSFSAYIKCIQYPPIYIFGNELLTIAIQFHTQFGQKMSLRRKWRKNFSRSFATGAAVEKFSFRAVGKSLNPQPIEMLFNATPEKGVNKFQ